MSLRQRQLFHLAIVTAGLSAVASQAGAQARQPWASQLTLSDGSQTLVSGVQGARFRPATTAVPSQGASAPTPSGEGAGAVDAGASATARRSMFDEPATSARIEFTGDRLSINAANASLSEVIRQVAARTGMQVEGNSHDERVFGVYGPGSAPDVLSALLYDSGYNVIMVGRTVDGAPRRLVLSLRGAATASQGAAVATRNNDDEDDDVPQQEVQQPPPPPNPVLQAAPASPPVAGQPRTPQQMLEELQRMHAGQQSQDLPHD